MQIVCATHQGLVRLNNEDAVLADADAGWVILADGMGGLLAGEEASGLAVYTVQMQLQAGATDLEPGALILDAHSAVQAHAEQKNYLGKMGTTLLVWMWRDGNPIYSHVGDSRIYAASNGELEQLSKDQTVGQRMIDQGLVPKGQKGPVPHQNVLTQALGMPGEIEPEVGVTPKAGRLLLCSDGLSDMIRPATIQDRLQEADLERCAQNLLRCALDAGGRDNVTVAVIDLDQ